MAEVPIAQSATTPLVSLLAWPRSAYVELPGVNRWMWRLLTQARTTCMPICSADGVPLAWLEIATGSAIARKLWTRQLVAPLKKSVRVGVSIAIRCEAEPAVFRPLAIASAIAQALVVVQASSGPAVAEAALLLKPYECDVTELLVLAELLAKAVARLSAAKSKPVIGVRPVGFVIVRTAVAVLMRLVL